MTEQIPERQDARAQPRDSQRASGTTKLVTVHGTGAGHKENTGERWWQLGSPFQAALASRLHLDPARVEIVPFQWELGPNSENGRRAAGMALFEQLKGYDRSGEDYYLMGHSHGGSVIYDALLHSVAKNKPFQGLKSWCTIGTPFLDYRTNRFLFSRLGTVGLTLYATALGAFAFAAGLVIKYLTSGGVLETVSSQYFASLILLLALIPFGYGLVCLAFLYAIERIRGSSYTPAHKKTVADIYRQRWLGLWHRDDEAISALSNVQFVKGSIIPSTFLVPFVAVVPVLVTVAGSLAAVYYFLPLMWTWLQANLSVLLETPVAGISAPAYSTVDTLKGIVLPIGVLAALAALYVAVTSAIVAVLKLAAGWVGLPIAKAIDNLVWTSVRQQAWGDDRQSEGVAQVGSQPPEFGAMFDPLPDAVGAEVSRFSEKHAILTLTKVREVLGMTRTPQAAPDMRMKLSEQLNWRELIHTTYFDIPEFIDLTAFALHRAGLAKLKDDFWDDSSRARAQEWARTIALPSSDASPHKQ